jgi:mRNA interferase MazF
VKRGEVWWWEPPDRKPRPFLVLSRDQAIDVMPTVLGVPARTRQYWIPTEVEVGQDDGLSRSCVLALDEIGPVRKAHLTRRITELGVDRMREVCRALSIAVDC